jgi:hypothetical protein
MGKARTASAATVVIGALIALSPRLVPAGNRARPGLRVGLDAACGAGARLCDVDADETGLCRVVVEACVDDRTSGGLTRLRLRGARAVTAPLGAVLGTLPGAHAAGRGLRFRPALASGCVRTEPLALAADERPTRLVAVARTARGRRVGARLRLRCRPAAARPVEGPGFPPPRDPTDPPLAPPAPPAAPPALRFARQVVDSEGGGQVTNGVATGDLDGDGRPDVVVAGDERLVWYRNPEWTLRTIATGRFGAGAMILVRDLDADGRPDVVTGSREGAPETVWLRNGPGGWTRHVLSRDAYCHDLAFGDLDGDGRADLACADQLRRRVAWLGAPADPAAPWRFHAIDPDQDAMGVAVADLDRDGALDVVAGRAWYRRDGDAWRRAVYTDVRADGYAGFDDYAKVDVLDLDGDGRLDVFATLWAETPVGRVYAFLAPPDPVREPWRAVLVDAGPLFGVHSQAAASFDGSARPQVMVGETNIGGFGFGVAPDPEVRIYRLLGAATDPAAWERTTVDRLGTHEAQAVDLDGDGLPDLVGHAENTDLVGTNGPVHAWGNETGL